MPFHTHLYYDSISCLNLFAHYYDSISCLNLFAHYRFEGGKIAGLSSFSELTSSVTYLIDFSNILAYMFKTFLNMALL